MIRNFIFPNKMRFKVVEKDKDFYIIRFIKNNQVVEDFYIPKQDDDQGIRNAIIVWYTHTYGDILKYRNSKSKELK